MRFPKIMTLPVLAALALAPVASHAQINATVHIGPTPRAWGHEIVINPYAQDKYGDWHTSYRRWQPVTMYFHDGRYFDRQVRGSRPVMVYRAHGEYFLPPQDRDWNNKDRRYNYKRVPNDDDYNRPRPGGPPHDH
jgi:hypothetical protein